MGYITLRARISNLVIDANLDMAKEEIPSNRILTEVGHSLLQENGDYLLSDPTEYTGFNIIIAGDEVSTDCILVE